MPSALLNGTVERPRKRSRATRSSAAALIEVAAGLAGLLGREPGDLGAEIEQGLQVFPDVAVLEVEHLVQAARLRDLARRLALQFGGPAGPPGYLGRGLAGPGRHRLRQALHQLQV